MSTWDTTVQCPHCSYKIDNLHEFFYDASAEEIFIECPRCETTLVLIRSIEISYSVKLL